MQRVWVWLWVSITMAFDRSTHWFDESTCSARAEDPRSPLLRARQCSQRRHSSFVGCRVVGVKAQILICVDGLRCTEELMEPFSSLLRRMSRKMC